MKPYLHVYDEPDYISLVSDIAQASYIVINGNDSIVNLAQLHYLAACNTYVLKLGRVTAYDIVGHFSCSYPNAIKMLTKLTEAGLLECQKHLVNQESHFFVTTSGKRVLKAFNNSIDNLVQSRAAQESNI